MPTFGARSREQFDTIHPDMQKVLTSTIQIKDFSIICGFRDEHTQNMHFMSKASRVRFPDSKHNTLPSLAVDIAPYHKDFGLLLGTNTQVSKISKRLGLAESSIRAIILQEFYYLSGVMTACAYTKGVQIRWGGDWDRDSDFFDNSFNDLMHFEIYKGKRKWHL